MFVTKKKKRERRKRRNTTPAHLRYSNDVERLPQSSEVFVLLSPMKKKKPPITIDPLPRFKGFMISYLQPELLQIASTASLRQFSPPPSTIEFETDDDLDDDDEDGDDELPLFTKLSFIEQMESVHTALFHYSKTGILPRDSNEPPIHNDEPIHDDEAAITNEPGDNEPKDSGGANDNSSSSSDEFDHLPPMIAMF